MTDWQLDGKYLSMRVDGSVRDVGRSMYNLVNMQGPGYVHLSPKDNCHQVLDCIEELDPGALWRNWWKEASGLTFVPTDGVVERDRVPMHSLPRSMSRSGRGLGINVGGRYARFIWLSNGHVEAVQSVDLEEVHDNAYVKGSVEDLAASICEREASRGLAFIGIAWSAPRTNLGLRAMSLQMRRVGAAAEELQRGTLDSLLTDLCKCPVMSWNDGEAVAAAEGRVILKEDSGSTLVFKLGTSFATGMAMASGISALPMQMAKCLLRVRPICGYVHPAVGIRGTARDLLGAESIERTYAQLSGNPLATYDDFVHGANLGEALALRIVNLLAAGLSELCQIVENIWGPVSVVVTGKNVSDGGLRRLLSRELVSALVDRGVQTRPLKPIHDVDLAAAIGAAMLTYGALR